MADEPAREPAVAPSTRTRVRRHPERARYERAELEAILDEALVCHLGFADERGPVVVPTTFARVGDGLYLHGAPGNAALRALVEGAPVCVEVTVLDGLVLARSAYHHSMNYRSAIVFGRALEVVDDAEKAAALAAIVDRVAPGRAADARPPSPGELRGTRVVRVDLGEASVKVRAAGPIDEEDDLERPTWAGVVPIEQVRGEPVEDLGPAGPIPLPDYLARAEPRR